MSHFVTFYYTFDQQHLFYGKCIYDDLDNYTINITKLLYKSINKYRELKGYKKIDKSQLYIGILSISENHIYIENEQYMFHFYYHENKQVVNLNGYEMPFHISMKYIEK